MDLFNENWDVLCQPPSSPIEADSRSSYPPGVTIN